MPIVPPRPAHSEELIGHCLMVRSKHCSERGGDHVELVVAKWKCLGVALRPLQLDPLSTGFAAAGLEIFRRKVGRDDSRPGLGRTDGRVAGSRSDVEHSLTR
jgi:hypothetical protein